MKKIIVTGAGGLIGSEVSEYYANLGWDVIGIDNNMRAKYFGFSGDIKWNISRLETKYSNFTLISVDIRNRKEIEKIILDIKPLALVHCAAQPSHDLATEIIYDDFDVNAVGTLNLLESLRKSNYDIPFVFLSTNKVYGDAPNNIALIEKETRWDFAELKNYNGINEEFNIDQSTHSFFGVSKLAADLLVQEYGRYFGMSTCCLRGGCLTGPNHSGVELHGFLSYLVKCNVLEKEYTIMGYKGKQVRDNIHSIDIVKFIDLFIRSPKSGEVYNIGGGRANSISIIEAFEMINNISGKKMKYKYANEPRKGDHICYISDLNKISLDYPEWEITKNLTNIFEELYKGWIERLN